MQNETKNLPAKTDRAAKLAAAKQRNAAKQAAKPVATDATPSELTRAARAIKNAETCLARGATNFGELTARDYDYTALYGAISRAIKSDILTIADILALSPLANGKAINPLYVHGTNGAADGGVLNRLNKSGLFSKIEHNGRPALRVNADTKTLKAFTAYDIANRQLTKRHDY